MLKGILESLSNYNYIEWIGLITGLIYIFLSAKNKITCWYFGIVSCACIAYHDFFGDLKLYSDGVLQLFYILAGFWGLYQWSRKEISHDTDLKQSSNVRIHGIAIVIGLLLSLVYGYLMRKWTDSAFPIIDAFTTVFSIIATVLLTNRNLSAWVYFVIIDIIMTVLYTLRGFDLYALLFLVYTIFAIYAIWHWPRIAKVTKVSSFK